MSTSKMMSCRLVLGARHVEVDEVLLSEIQGPVERGIEPRDQGTHDLDRDILVRGIGHSVIL